MRTLLPLCIAGALSIGCGGAEPARDNSAHAAVVNTDTAPSAFTPVKLHRGRGLVSDEMHVWSDSNDFAAGSLERASADPANRSDHFGSLLILADDRASVFPRRGTWTSQEFEVPTGFVELLPSWNARTPHDTGIRIDGRVRIASEWSPWLDFGYWGRTPPPTAVEAFEHGKVAVDILQLSEAADAYQLRASFFDYRVGDGAAANPPALLRLAAVASGAADSPQDHQPVEWSGDHHVPFIAQRSAGEQIGGDICSPTCVTMVASYYGAARPLVDNALAIYDTEHGIFGNWNRAVARAGELGLVAELRRFDSIDQARQLLRDGRPLIISIRYKAGEAPSFVMEKTSGHLIVLRGVTPEGDFIVNDPASAQRGEAAVYRAADVHTAWLQNADGVGYVIWGR